MSAWKPIDEQTPAHSTSVMLAWEVEPGRWWVGEGWRYEDDGRWYEANSHPTDYTDGEVFPTLWQPLPSPPGSDPTPDPGLREVAAAIAEALRRRGPSDFCAPICQASPRRRLGSGWGRANSRPARRY